MMTVAPDLRTLGRLVADLQVSYATLEAVVRERNIAPALMLNGIPHYDAAAVEKIVTAVRTSKPREARRA